MKEHTLPKGREYSPYREYGYMQWSEAIKHIGLKPSRRVVLQELAWHDNANRECIMSIDQIAKRTGISSRTADRIIPELGQAGLISWVPGGMTDVEEVDENGEVRKVFKRDANVYVFHLTPQLEKELQKREAMRQPERQNGAQQKSTNDTKRQNGVPITTDKDIGKDSSNRTRVLSKEGEERQNGAQGPRYSRRIEGSLEDRFSLVKTKMEETGEEIDLSISLDMLEYQADRKAGWGSESDIHRLLRPVEAY